MRQGIVLERSPTPAVLLSVFGCSIKHRVMMASADALPDRRSEVAVHALDMGARAGCRCA